MSEQPDLFSRPVGPPVPSVARSQGGRLNPPVPTLGERIAAGEAARDEGITRAEEHAPDVWWELAWGCVRAVAAVKAEFTTDDVWELLEAQPAPAPPEPRAMGAIMRRAKRERLAEPTDRTKLSTRPACHRRPVRVWASL